MQHHDVRDNGIDIDPRRIDHLRALREPARIEMIAGGAIDQLFKRHAAAHGREASLAHAAAKRALPHRCPPALGRLDHCHVRRYPVGHRHAPEHRRRRRGYLVAS